MKEKDERRRRENSTPKSDEDNFNMPMQQHWVSRIQWYLSYWKEIYIVAQTLIINNLETQLRKGIFNTIKLQFTFLL